MGRLGGSIGYHWIEGRSSPTVSRSVTDAQMARLSIERDAFHGEWNYSLCTRERIMALKFIVAKIP